MDILFAQYSDLEALLVLARREAEAAEHRDFDQILEVVKQRATLGDRLEVYHRQLAELRSKLGSTYGPQLEDPVVARTVSVVEAIRLEDSRTLPLLVAARGEALEQSMRAGQARRNLGAYASGGPKTPVACDKHI
jgi:hypothetical protein